ncbi:MAG TPA: hypothetical protein VJ867_05905 [Gemmatimonadaceae bacterium]|nr:hypothetical protein [Gemmatimonadaceae bacterium]
MSAIDAHQSESAESALALSGPAMLEWSRVVDAVLRGLGHALNNRAAALSAVIELSKDDDGGTEDILTTELHRVRELAAVVRTMGRPRGGVEAFSPRDAADEAQAVLALHAEQRDRVVLIESAASTAVRVPKWMYVRALIALIASIPARAGTHSVRVTVDDRGEWIAVVASDVPAVLETASPFTTEVVRAMRGELLPDAYGFRLPSLAALRKREGR